MNTFELLRLKQFKEIDFWSFLFLVLFELCKITVIQICCALQVSTVRLHFDSSMGNYSYANWGKKYLVLWE
jgi:hypothetical protein